MCIRDRGYAAGKAFGKVYFATHGAFRNGLYLIAYAGADGELINNFGFNKCGIHIKADQTAHTSIPVSYTHLPPDEDGSADLKYVLEVARTIGRNMKQYKLVVTKSTVPVGTADKVRAVIQEELDKRGVNIHFDVASNPEFLKEGNAISDFMSPDRVVVGVESERAQKLM